MSSATPHEGEPIPDAWMQWEEWGCPKDKAYYQYMQSYSPVDNIKRAVYPNILVTAGLGLPNFLVIVSLRLCQCLRRVLA